MTNLIFLSRLVPSRLDIAPEVLSVRPYDHRVDWWSLGILAYACLFGEYPVSATKDHVTMANKVLNHKFQLPAEVSPNRTAIKDLLWQLLEKNPNQRLATLEQLRQTSYMSNVDFERIYAKNYSPLRILMKSNAQWCEELQKEYFPRSPSSTNAQQYFPCPSSPKTNRCENLLQS